MKSSSIRLLSPVGRVASPDSHIAPRIGDLNGRILGILDNQKENAPIFLCLVKQLLCQRYRLKEVLYFTKVFPAEPARNLEEITEQCDFVVNGVGS